MTLKALLCSRTWSNDSANISLQPQTHRWHSRYYSAVTIAEKSQQILACSLRCIKEPVNVTVQAEIHKWFTKHYSAVWCINDSANVTLQPQTQKRLGKCYRSLRHTNNSANITVQPQVLKQVGKFYSAPLNTGNTEQSLLCSQKHKAQVRDLTVTKATDVDYCMHNCTSEIVTDLKYSGFGEKGRRLGETLTDYDWHIKVIICAPGHKAGLICQHNLSF